MATLHDVLKNKPFKRLGSIRNIMVFFLFFYTLAEFLAAALYASVIWATKMTEAGNWAGIEYYQFLERIEVWSVTLGYSYLLILLCCFIFVGWFTFRAMRNLHIIDAYDADMSPAGTIIWHAVPIACFFMPYSGMSQIWRGSADPKGSVNSTPLSMKFWWTGWVVATIGGSLARRILQGSFGEEISTIMAGLYTGAIAGIFGTMAGICLILFSKSIVKNQDAIANARGELSSSHEIGYLEASSA